MWKHALIWIAAAAIIYLAIAYVAMPLWWRAREKRHPALSNAPTITHTHSAIPGDPLNLGLIGSEEQLVRGMLAAGWHPADPLSLKSSIRIADDTVFHRPYEDAPVSNLYLYGRKEDLAYELPVGNDPKQRHHVRFWKAPELDAEGRPFWFGAATFDSHVGLSHTTGQITHHIAPDVDAERYKILTGLEYAGALVEHYYIDAFQPNLTGKNGGGDPWQTDGRLGVGVLRNIAQQ